MSLWICPTHGLYGGDVFCPKCGGTGEYVTLSPLERSKASYRPLRDVDELVGITERVPASAAGARERQDRADGLGPKDARAARSEAKGDAQTTKEQSP